MIVVARSLAFEVIAVVVAPIPSFSVVTVVTTPRVSVVKTSTAVVPLGRLLSSSDAFSDEFFCIVSVAIIFGRGKEFGDRGRPLGK